MATYTYTGQAVSYSSVLVESLRENSITDATFVIDGTTVTVTTTAAEATCDTAVADANDATLFSNKSVKKDVCRANTLTLVDTGVETWSAGDFVKLTKKTANGYYEDWTYLNANPTKLTAGQPYVLINKDNEEISTATLTDIETLADDAADRWSYLIDGQKDLTDSIDAAVDQAALDAITDTRT